MTEQQLAAALSAAALLAFAARAVALPASGPSPGPLRLALAFWCGLLSLALQAAALYFILVSP